MCAVCGAGNRRVCGIEEDKTADLDGQGEPNGAMGQRHVLDDHLSANTPTANLWIPVVDRANRVRSKP